MFKLSLMFLLTLLSLQVFCEDSDIIKKLQVLAGQEQIEDIKIKPLRFEYNEIDHGQKLFYATLKKKSIIQNLDGTMRYMLLVDSNMRFKEIKSDDLFTYIVNKNGKPIFVCLTRDLIKIDHLISMRPKDIPFKKADIQYNKINLDQTLLLNSLLSFGQHTFAFDQSASSQQSVSINLEAGFKEQKLLPFMLTANLTKLSSSVIEWNYLTFGLKLFKNFSVLDNKKIQVYIEAQRDLLGFATLQETSVSIDLNRYILGATLNSATWLYGLEIFNERAYFPGEVNLADYGIKDNDTFKTGFALKIGKEFEINL